jgi:hypothetical protein
MNIGFLIVFIFIICYPILDAKRDSEIEKGNPVNHNLNAVNYGFISVILALSLFYVKIPLVEEKDRIIEFIQLFLVIIGFRWIIFDLSYNLFMGHPTFYIGETSTIDKLMRKIPFSIYLILKTIVAFFSFLLSLQWLFR